MEGDIQTILNICFGLIVVAIIIGLIPKKKKG